MTTSIANVARRVWPLIRRYGFDALVVLAALEASLELAYGRTDNKTPPTGSLWVLIPLTLLVFVPARAKRDSQPGRRRQSSSTAPRSRSSKDAS